MSRSAVHDSVDRVLRGWAGERPELDVAPVAVVARLGRLRALLDAELDALFARHGLSAADFSVLATLTRLGAPFRVPQRRLMDELGLTSGTVSVRVDRLVAAGLVAREPDPYDGRGTLVALTEDGRAAFDAVAPEHLANERRLLAALDDEEREQLAGLLRKLLLSLEGPSPAEGPPGRLGLEVAPAHVAAKLRADVGLPEVPGLLVRMVEDDGPAARAGLRRGDLLTALDGAPLRSVAPLLAALAEQDALELDVVRGVEELRVRVALR